MSGIRSDFNMPWHESLMPIGPNYLAVERSVLECAYAGCNTIWIVCSDDTTPLIRYQVGEMVQDPVYSYRHFEFNKTEFKRPIRIYYVPIKIRDINKRNNLSWSAIHGAKTANKILKNISNYLTPEKFWISWPYGYSDPAVMRKFRKNLISDDMVATHKGRSVRDNLFLGMTLDMNQIEQLVIESKTRSTGMWVDPGTRRQKHSPDDRFSYRNFNLQKVFETLDFSAYQEISIDNYYDISSWIGYCKFLSENSSIKKPKILKYAEWNGVGVDEEE